MLIFLSSFLLAAFLAAILVALYLPLAARGSWLDSPTERSSHSKPTVSSGGLPVVLALAVVCLIAVFFFAVPVERLSSIGAPAGVLLLMGAWDDRRPLPAWPRLVVFFLVATFTVAALMTDTESATVSLPLRLVLIVALAWLMNLYNFMDGIDGLAALQCVIVAGALGLLGVFAGASTPFVALALATAGAYSGFLWFNWSPARLFMGDAGSLVGGFLLGALGLWGWQSGVISPVSWLLLLSPFLLDTGVTLGRRAWRRERLSHAHRSHFYQRLARHWGSHARVCLGLLILDLCWLVPLAFAAAFRPDLGLTILLLGLFPQLVLMAKWWTLQ